MPSDLLASSGARVYIGSWKSLSREGSPGNASQPRRTRARGTLKRGEKGRRELFLWAVSSDHPRGEGGRRLRLAGPRWDPREGRTLRKRAGPSAIARSSRRSSAKRSSSERRPPGPRSARRAIDLRGAGCSRPNSPAIRCGGSPPGRMGPPQEQGPREEGKPAGLGGC